MNKIPTSKNIPHKGAIPAWAGLGDAWHGPEVSNTYPYIRILSHMPEGIADVRREGRAYTFRYDKVSDQTIIGVREMDGWCWKSEMDLF